MPTIHTPSRLHFGLLSLAGGAEAWLDRGGEPRLPSRRFGGVGLMVERHGVHLAATTAAAWSADGPLAERALAFALRFADSVRREQPDADLAPQRLVVQQAPPEHIGLGVGTQLGMAVARALAEAWGLTLDTPGLARRVGRGLRSALGVHGFAHGGFLVESGKSAAGEGLAPLTVRLDFPPDWRLVLATPGEAPGRHGLAEREAFADLVAQALRDASPQAARRTDALCRLVLLGMAPAVAEADLEAFGECLWDFNARVGEAFAAVQGGVYAGPRVAELVDHLRQAGIRGVGQSSWGPTVFAVTADEERAEDLRRRLVSRCGLGMEVWTTPACNRGAWMEAD